MATLYVAEMKGTKSGAIYVLNPIGIFPLIAEQQVSIGVTSNASNPFNALTNMIRVNTDTTCLIEYGQSPIASTSSVVRMVAGQTEYFYVQAGQQIAVIESS